MLRVRIGLAADDVTQDAELAAAWELAIHLAEQYTDRFLTHAERSETFTHYRGGNIQLRAYPEIAIIDITGWAGTAPGYHLADTEGTLYIDGDIEEHQITIQYTGGYTIFPDSLNYAIIMIFDQVWAMVNNPGAGSSTAGAIKSIKAGDISIQYDTGGSAAPGSAGALGGAISPMAQGILQTYSRWPV